MLTCWSASERLRACSVEMRFRMRANEDLVNGRNRDVHWLDDEFDILLCSGSFVF